MSILQGPHSFPEVILFDWHATLVNTHDAMYQAINDMLPQLPELGLWQQLQSPDQAKTPEDARLLRYVLKHQTLHPKIVAQQKISRTDIFEILFGENESAKAIAHQAFDDAYRQHAADVFPLETDIALQLQRLDDVGIATGVISNRRREFLMRELASVDNGRWQNLFDVVVCGTDVSRRKPAPDMLLYALAELEIYPSKHCWYVGDSTTDVIAAGEAGITSIFYNGANWSDNWLDKIFPGTLRHPHRPDAVVNSIAEVTRLARLMRAQQIRVQREKTRVDALRGGK
mgnify:CR=1 FL=1